MSSSKLETTISDIISSATNVFILDTTCSCSAANSLLMEYVPIHPPTRLGLDLIRMAYEETIPLFSAVEILQELIDVKGKEGVWLKEDLFEYTKTSTEWPSFMDFIDFVVQKRHRPDEYLNKLYQLLSPRIKNIFIGKTISISDRAIFSICGQYDDRARKTIESMLFFQASKKFCMIQTVKKYLW